MEISNSTSPNSTDQGDKSSSSGLSRRQLLAGVPLAAFGGAAVGDLNLGGLVPSASAASANTETAETNKSGTEELDDFVFDLERDGKGWTGPGGSAKEVAVAEFPLSKSIAGVSMRLNPGGFRELHWHAIAAEWAYVLEGQVRTTVIAPDGTTETDDFQVGDVWYFPKGHGHALQNIGNTPCHFLLGFDNGHFNER